MVVVSHDYENRDCRQMDRYLMEFELPKTINTSGYLQRVDGGVSRGPVDLEAVVDNAYSGTVF